MVRAAWFLAPLLALACGATEPAPEPEPPASPAPAEATANPPAAWPDDDGCGALRQQIEDALGEATYDCQADADCGCYPAMINCGGVASTATVERLGPLAQRFASEGCEYRGRDGSRFNCAPWQCRPQCVDGRCRR